MTRLKDSRKSKRNPDFRRFATDLAHIGRGFYARGWSLGTSGNLSAVSQRDPLHLAITASGLDKGLLVPAQILEIDAEENVLQGNGRPSAEAAIHVSIVHARAAGSVLHTHSVWSTVLSQKHVREGQVEINGYEMLKGLEGVRTHNHTEHLPILENSQNMKELSDRVADLLEKHPAIHGFLLRGHGLYTWGATTLQAKRHVEILEFLLEVVGRSTEMTRP
jgi:methylthioribulose-1-phosphate dehydratase